MNTGIIASRYATALLKLVDETGFGELVAAQVQAIEAALDGSPDFRRAIDDPSVPDDRKLALFEAAVASPALRQAQRPMLSMVAEPVEAPRPEALAPELRKFIQLLIRNGRIGDVRLVFITFITEYYRSRHIKCARLTVADPSLLSPSVAVVRQAQRPGTPSLESRLRDLVEKQTGCRLELKTKVDPTLIGGFVFEVDDLRLDASVSRQIDLIRRQFIEKNRRIV